MASASPKLKPPATIELSSGVWREESHIALPVPENWDVVTLWPQTTPPLSDGQIERCLWEPVGQPPLAEICQGKSRPLVIVDDLNRPTPAFRIIPFLLRIFQQAGIPPAAVRVLISTGTHGLPDSESAALKVGGEAAASCQVLVHNCKRDVVRAGTTTFGLGVYVNPAVISSDLVVGIGGIYPNQTAGFGGGSKLLLGVLGFRTIRSLHFRNSSLGWGAVDSGAASNIRRDLDEIARMLKLRTSIAVHIDARRDIVRLACGEPSAIANEEMVFARATFDAPGPGEADVVISNAYPNDVSLTSALQKGLTPLANSASGASRILIASCPDGVGHHGLFPVSNNAGLFRLKFIARRLANMSLRELAKKFAHRPPKPIVKRNAIWLFRPGENRDAFSVIPPGFRSTPVWDSVLEGVAAEQGYKNRLRAVVYPCAPLQILNGTALQFSGGKNDFR